MNQANREPVHAAIDLGHSNAKIAKLVGVTTLEGYYNAVNERKRGDVEAPALQSMVCAAAAAPRKLLVDTMGQELPGLPVEVDGEMWQSLIDFRDMQHSSSRDLTESYVGSKRWRALLLGCLLALEEDEVDVLVMGLPCKEYYQHPELIEKVVELAKGEHQIQGKTIQVKDVKVIPQPLGSFYGYLMESDKEMIQALMENVVLVVDPGFYSTDIALIVEGRRLNQVASISSANSVKPICDKLHAKIEGKQSINIQQERIEALLRQEKTTMALPTGKVYDFSEDLKEVSQEVAEAALTEVRNSLRSVGLSPSIGISTGGGGKMFEPHIKKGTGVNAVFSTSTPVEMNVLGYLRAAY